jgi:hypothetical protein
MACGFHWGRVRLVQRKTASKHPAAFPNCGALHCGGSWPVIYREASQFASMLTQARVLKLRALYSMSVIG